MVRRQWQSFAFKLISGTLRSAHALGNKYYFGFPFLGVGVLDILHLHGMKQFRLKINGRPTCTWLVGMNEFGILTIIYF